MEKQQFVDQLKQLLNQDVAEVKDQVEELKNNFYRIYRQEQETVRNAAEEVGDAAAEAVAEAVAEAQDAAAPVVDELEKEFRDLLNEFKRRKAELNKQMEEQMEQNLLRKENIIAQMKELAAAETADVMKDLQKMRDLQAEWKTIGAVPQQKVQELWKQYNMYQEQFYDLVKINIELRDLDFRKNLDLKTAICEKAEALKDNPSIVEANRILQQLHDEWSEIGPVARELREDLWNRFKEASSVINKKHQEYFDQLHSKEEENLEKKRALIERIKEIDITKLRSNKAWDEATEKIQAIQNEWRTIGFAPKKYNQSIYDEYRAASEAFFQAKTAYYKTIRDTFSQNLKLKKELLAKAEELKSSTDWKEATDAFVQLQAEWKKVGPVARKYSDEIWKSFSAACDAFFEAKREATKADREASQARRAEAKERYAKRLEGMTDRNRLVKMYESLQQEIRTAENNILFFTSKKGSKLLDSMQAKIETLKAQLSDIENKINQMDAEDADN